MFISNKGKLVLIPLMTGILVACGGGGSSASGTSDGGSPGDTGGGDTGTSGVQTGSFQDSPVQNLSYVTSSGMSGTTNAAGEFEYTAGDVVTFSLAGSKLGSTLGGQVVTPMNMVMTGEESDKSSNILRLLQSLDEDGNPDNGIVISENVRNVIEASPIDFNVDSATFESDMTVISALGEVGAGALISEADARAHFEGTLQGLENNEVDIRGTWSVVTTNPIACPGVSAVEVRAYSETGVSVSGNELSTRENECVKEPIEFSMTYSQLEANQEIAEEFCGPTCTLDELNHKYTQWTRSDTDGTFSSLVTSIVTIAHVKDSGIRTRTKEIRSTITDTSTGETSTSIVSSFVSTSYRQSNYAIDLTSGTGEWTYTQRVPNVCSVSADVTFDANGLTIVGEVIGGVSGGNCGIENINQTFSYAEAPAQFCGPTCDFEDLNRQVEGSSGNVLSLFHRKDTDRFTIIDGDMVVSVVRKDS